MAFFEHILPNILENKRAENFENSAKCAYKPIFSYSIKNSISSKMSLTTFLHSADDLYTYQLAVHMYRYHHNLLPPGLPNNSFAVQSDIHSYNTRQALNFHIDSTNTKLAENTIKIQGPIIWNSINKTTKNCRSLASFKKSLKKQILAQYNSNVITNKYAPLS